MRKHQDVKSLNDVWRVMSIRATSTIMALMMDLLARPLPISVLFVAAKSLYPRKSAYFRLVISSNMLPKRSYMIVSVASIEKLQNCPEGSKIRGHNH